MLNILHPVNSGRDWYMVRHYNVSPLIPNQYPDMCKRTCLDHNALLIKCDAVSAEIAAALGSRHLKLASDNIDSLSITSHTIQDISVECVIFIKLVYEDKYF